MALEASAGMGPFGVKGPPGGEENWERQMREHRDKGKGKQVDPQAGTGDHVAGPAGNKVKLSNRKELLEQEEMGEMDNSDVSACSTEWEASLTLS